MWVSLGRAFGPSPQDAQKESRPLAGSQLSFLQQSLQAPPISGTTTDDYGLARVFRELVVGFVRFCGAGQEVSRPSSRSPRIPTLRA